MAGFYSVLLRFIKALEGNDECLLGEEKGGRQFLAPNVDEAVAQVAKGANVNLVQDDLQVAEESDTTPAVKVRSRVLEWPGRSRSKLIFLEKKTGRHFWDTRKKEY